MSDHRDVPLGERVAQRAQVGTLSAARRPREHNRLPSGGDCVPDKLHVEGRVGDLVPLGDNEVFWQRRRRRRPQDGADLRQCDPTVRGREVLLRRPIHGDVLEDRDALRGAMRPKTRVDLVLQRGVSLVAVPNAQLAEKRLTVLCTAKLSDDLRALGFRDLGEGDLSGI